MLVIDCQRARVAEMLAAAGSLLPKIGKRVIRGQALARASASGPGYRTAV